MAKMYYTEAEAAQRLNKTPAELLNMARQGKLHVYADGTNKMYKVAEVDAIAGPGARPNLSGESDIQLTPADTSGSSGSRIGLSDTDTDVAAPGKGDTVITSEGISIFDDEDLEIATADPMAKTQIAPSLEDQLNLDNVSGGSGLLDLTRESDDTSLGEVLDHIDAGGSGAPAAAVAADIGQIETAETVVVEAPVAAYERPDPSAGAFTGLLVIGTLLMIVVGAVALAALLGAVPGYVEAMARRLPMVVGVAAVLAIIGAVIGYFVGKSSARPATAG